jgi:myo-inositol-1(or 4)-monophosphatase
VTVDPRRVADPVALRDLALATAREAGELIVRLRRDGVEVAGTKSSDIDIVTAADRASERLVLDRLLGARPDDGLVGEEGDDLRGTSGVVWIVDPIDGTVNYLYDLPAYAVSVAVEVDGEIVAGVVRNAPLGEEYAATKGGGATLDGRPLRVRDVVPLGQRLVATGFSYEVGIRTDQGRAVTAMLPQIRDVRRIGSCALDLCAIAAGRLDGYVEEGAFVWDYAAGGLIAEEAGASVEVTSGAHGRDLVICAPAGGFGAFRTLVAECGF